MIRRVFQWLAVGLFCIYVAVFPGSTLTVALDRVPAWGEWMGGALLFLQGMIVLGWLIARYGRRGALAAALVFGLAWGVEWLGVNTGFPFGSYRYTDLLQPQLLGVPLAIPCAWLMVVLGATHFRSLILDFRLPVNDAIKNPKSKIHNLVLAATLVLLLDLQIETVATRINRYWVWLDGGAYYGVPAVNFVAWWLVGLAMAAIIAGLLGDRRPTTDDRRWTKGGSGFTFYVLRFTFDSIPACLYMLNTLMFSVINLARGYTVAGLVGAIVALMLALLAWPAIRSRWRTRLLSRPAEALAASGAEARAALEPVELEYGPGAHPPPDD